MKFQEVVLSFIKKERLVRAGDKIVVGVSGGADSVALTHALMVLRPALGIQLHLAHYNHQMRTSADRDQRFVEGLARRFELPLTVDIRRVKDSVKGLSEDEARRLRLSFLTRLAKNLGASAIALGHHQDDLAETVLMRLIRGTGISGLRGILAVRQMDGVALIRPFMTVNRVQIEAYLRQQRLKFCQDETNQQSKFLRNRVRLELLPLLARKYNPGIADALLDLAHTAQEDYDFLSLEAQKRFKEKIVRRAGEVKIELSALLEFHPAMQRLLMRNMFETLIADGSVLMVNHMRELEDLLNNRPLGSQVHLLKKVTAHKTKRFLILSL